MQHKVHVYILVSQYLCP